MVTLLFLSLLLLSGVVALVDWRRGWYFAILCGVLQDPARKLTEGSPVVMTFSIVLIYMLVLISARPLLPRAIRDIARRMAALYLAGGLVALALLLGAANGLMTFGLKYWQIPALSLIVYTIPVPAALLGYLSLGEDEKLVKLFTFYAVITSISLIGVLLEYKGVSSRALGLVGLNSVTIRYMPGIEIRMLSGFYRAPDVMGWHAAMLTIVGMAMALRQRSITRVWPWMLVSAWGFTSCILSGRRKAIYMVAVFALAFVWRYARRLNATQIASFVCVALAIGLVLHKAASSEESGVYVRGAATTSDEIFARLEGGISGTIEQVGVIGAGLGSATQGTYHLAGSATTGFGWQEGGLGKLAMEVGVPGVIVVGLFVFALIRLMLAISRAPDEPGTSQIMRATLFGIAAANITNFLVSAQAYSDPLLTLLSAYLVGALLGSAALNDQPAPAAEITPSPLPARA
jgi:hypothetical protein